MGFLKDWVGSVVSEKIQTMMDGMIANPLWVDSDYRQIEYKLQYQGDTQEICRFYQSMRQRSQFVETNLFWEKVKGNLPIQHFPLARMITKAKANLVFHDKPNVSVMRGTDKDEEMTSLIADLWKRQSITSFLRKAAETLSYSGAVGLVPMRSAGDSKVIWRAYPKEACDVTKVYGQTTSLTVYDEIESDKRNYILQTTIANDGISYKLYRIDKDLRGRKTKKAEVPLTELDDTRDLRDLSISNPKGIPLFAYVENNLDGSSDYHGLIDDFSALDESYSALTDLIRKGHIKTYFPKSSLIKDKDGNGYVPNDFDENVTAIPMANPTNQPYKVERDQITLGDGVTALQNAFAFHMERAIESAGLSPATLGMDSAGANSSALALNIRERTSMRTRAEAVSLWSDAICRMVEATLSLTKAQMTEGGLMLDDSGATASVSFPEYESPTFDEKVQSLSTALGARLIDLPNALRELYPTKLDEELESMAVSIEGGMPKTAEEIEAEQAQKDEEEKAKSEQDKGSGT